MEGQSRLGDPRDDAIDATRTAFAGALTRGDVKAATACYAPGARLLPPSAELLKGRPAIEAFWEAGLKAGVTGVELEPLEIERRDVLAYEIGRYALRLNPVDGPAVVDRGRYLLVLAQREDGTWERTVEMFNPAAPVTATSGPPALGGNR